MPIFQVGRLSSRGTSLGLPGFSAALCTAGTLSLQPYCLGDLDQLLSLLIQGPLSQAQEFQSPSPTEVPDPKGRPCLFTRRPTCGQLRGQEAPSGKTWAEEVGKPGSHWWSGVGDLGERSQPGEPWPAPSWMPPRKSLLPAGPPWNHRAGTWWAPTFVPRSPSKTVSLNTVSEATAAAGALTSLDRRRQPARV